MVVWNRSHSQCCAVAVSFVFWRYGLDVEFVFDVLRERRPMMRVTHWMICVACSRVAGSDVKPGQGELWFDAGESIA